MNSSWNEKCFGKKFWRKNTRFMFVTCSKNHSVCEIMWYSKRGHRWQYNMVHAHCVLDKYVYKQTISIWNTYCFSTATMVTRRRLNVTLYVHCLSFLSFVASRKSNLFTSVTTQNCTENTYIMSHAKNTTTLQPSEFYRAKTRDGDLSSA
jgi:hypothetical protein